MSLISFSLTHARFAARLGLLAMALLFVAPVIAKALAHTHGAGSIMMHHQMHEECSQPMPTPSKPSPLVMKADLVSMHHPMSMMDDSACDYCVLLVHLAFGLTAIASLWQVRRASAPPALPLLLPVINRITLRFFHPRAPPYFFVSH